MIWLLFCMCAPHYYVKILLSFAHANEASQANYHSNKRITLLGTIMIRINRQQLNTRMVAYRSSWAFDHCTSLYNVCNARNWSWSKYTPHEWLWVVSLCNTLHTQQYGFVRSGNKVFLKLLHNNTNDTN